MTKGFMMISAAIMALMAGTSALARGSFFQIVPVPNSTSTTVFGINDSGIITGSWLDASGLEHGYVGPASGTSYTSFDDPNSPGPGTEPRAINNNGYITGFSDSQSGATTGDIPFERDPGGNITEITKKGKLLNYLAQGINNKNNEFAASYVNSSLSVVGYLGESGTYKKAIKLSGIANTGVAGRGINNDGDIVGWYYDSSGVQHGFLMSGGVATTLDPNESNLASNVLEAINDKGVITGQWTDTSGVIHGYTYHTKRQKLTEIRVRSSKSFVQAWGINNQGMVAIDSDAGNFIYCPPRVTCSFAAHSPYKPAVRSKPQLP